MARGQRTTPANQPATRLRSSIDWRGLRATDRKEFTERALPEVRDEFLKTLHRYHVAEQNRAPYARDYLGGLDIEIDAEDLFIAESGRVHYCFDCVSYDRPGARKGKQQRGHRRYLADTALLLALVENPGSGEALSEEFVAGHLHPTL